MYEIVNQKLWFHGKMSEFLGNKEIYNKIKREAETRYTSSVWIPILGER